jgi:hypothetical protein
MTDIVAYSISLIDHAVTFDKVPYRKIPGITQFFLTLETVMEEL